MHISVCHRATGRLAILIFIVLCLASWQTVHAQEAEFRGMWVNAWNPGFQSASQVSTLIDRIRAANCNAVIPQVRRRGDAFYNSNYEPHVTGTTPSNFDALADIISKAHNTNAGPYVEVHAWVVTYHIWSGATNATTPPQPDHPLRLHPDWLLEDVNGEVFIGNQYTFDPGHPEVQRHTFNVCMDIVTNYNVDGLNFDYIRYSGSDEGYNPVTVARFNQRFGRTGKPLPTDPVWKQFRRDQITGLLRKVYLNAIAARPEVKISCDTITWHPGPANLSAWYSSSAAWNSVLQDWRGWMEEGIMDLNIPMAYFDLAGAYTLAWTNWNNFTKDHQYGRHAVIGPGIYLNSIADAITEMRYTRVASPSGNRAVGVCGYDYNTPFRGGAGQFGTFYPYLTSGPNAHDPLPGGLFPSPVSVPPMPWKVAPSKGHLKGTIYGGDPGNELDGAIVTLSGPVARNQTNDATGFYGFVDLPPGSYSVVASFPGYPTQTNTVLITAGVVTTLDVVLSTSGPPYIGSHPQDLTVNQGQTATFGVSANGSEPLTYQWRHNGSNIAGATGSSYSRDDAQAAHAGEYSVAISNALGFAISSDATLTVIVPPSIVGEPQDQSVDQGTDVTFTVEATGTEPLTYQWRFNSSLISGATGSAYTRVNAQPTETGNYSVVVSNIAGWATSRQAVLAVAQAPVPPSISAQPVSQTIAAGQNVTFEVQANGALPFAYQWRFAGVPMPGETAPSLALANVSTNQAGGYSVVITNNYGAATSQVAYLTVLPFFEATGLTRLWSLAPGSRPYMTVTSLPTERGMAYNPVTHRLPVASRSGPRVYVLDAETGADLHELNMSGVSGGTYSLLMIGVAEDGAVYAGNLTTAGATTAYKLYRWANDNPGTAPTVAFSGDPSPGNNQRWGDTMDVRGAGTGTQVLIGSRAGANAVVFTTANGTTFSPQNIDVSGASAGNWGLGIAFGAGNTFWGKANGLPLVQAGFNLQTGAGAIVRSHGSAEIPNTIAPIGVSTRFDLLAGINISSPNHLRLYSLGTPALTYIAATNFPADNDNTSTGTGAVDFGGDRVYALDANNGIVALRVQAALPPTIVVPPQDQAVKRGSNAVFSVVANGPAPMAYQWRFGDVDIPGATASSYTRADVTDSHAGDYSVRVNNNSGAAFGGPATLTVLLPGAAVLNGVDLLEGGQTRLRWTGDAGFVYTVETSTNLWFWENIGVAGSFSGAYEFIDRSATNGMRFYRVRD